ncbi:MAG TPA: hypothetical protein VF618_09350 [Thermoanaerobaculia bacterium]
MMRKAAFGLMLLLVSGAAFGQEEPQPDYSRDNLQRLVAEIEAPPEHPPRVEFGFGTVSFRALGTSWRFNYLPIMAPLAGTAMTTSRQTPDAFSLLGTAPPETPRTWRDRRERNAERRRIERITGGSAEVGVRRE